MNSRMASSLSFTARTSSSRSFRFFSIEPIEFGRLRPAGASPAGHEGQHQGLAPVLAQRDLRPIEGDAGEIGVGSGRSSRSRRPSRRCRQTRKPRTGPRPAATSERRHPRGDQPATAPASHARMAHSAGSHSVTRPSPGLAPARRGRGHRHGTALLAGHHRAQPSVGLEPPHPDDADDEKRHAIHCCWVSPRATASLVRTNSTRKRSMPGEQADRRRSEGPPA